MHLCFNIFTWAFQPLWTRARVGIEPGTLQGVSPTWLAH